MLLNLKSDFLKHFFREINFTKFYPVKIMENGNGNNNIPEIELIIKASTIDGRRKGACIFCQEYFMDLYLLAELKTISLKITTVDMKRPPPDFRSNFEAAQPPILVRSTNDCFHYIFSGSLKGDCNISRHKIC